MPVDPAARFQALSSLTRPPGTCFICKTDRHAPFVDTGLMHDFYRDAPDPKHDGDVVICSMCIREMFNTIGLYDGSTDTKVNNAYAAGLEIGVARGRDVINELVSTFDSLVSGTSSMPGGDDNSSSVDIIAPESAEPTSAVAIPETVKQGAKSNRSKRSDDVPSLRVDELFT